VTPEEQAAAIRAWIKVQTSKATPPRYKLPPGFVHVADPESAGLQAIAAMHQRRRAETERTTGKRG
jgi:hypothetical protein